MMGSKLPCRMDMDARIAISTCTSSSSNTMLSGLTQIVWMLCGALVC
jgi:hypothetical protein